MRFSRRLLFSAPPPPSRAVLHQFWASGRLKPKLLRTIYAQRHLRTPRNLRRLFGIEPYALNTILNAAPDDISTYTLTEENCERR